MEEQEKYMIDGQGRLVPVANVRAEDKLEDQLVNDLFSQAKQIQTKIANFKETAFSDVQAFLDILAEKYNISKGGKKGNMSFTSYDGKQKIVISVADFIQFGAQASKIRAFWLSLYHLGEVKDPSEDALVSFVRRMTNVHDLNWLTPAKADIVIRAFHNWAYRIGWLLPTGRRHDSVGAIKASLIRLQCKILEVNNWQEYLTGLGIDDLQIANITKRGVETADGLIKVDGIKSPSIGI